jgi:subtilisin family serine protease
MSRFPEELVHDSGVSMYLDPTRLLLSFTEPQSLEAVDATLTRVGFMLEDGRDDGPKDILSEVINHTDRRFWIRRAKGDLISDSELDRLESAARELGEVEFVGPVYRLGQGESRGSMLCCLPNVLLIKPESPVTAKNLPQRLKKYGMREVTERSRYLLDLRYCVIPEPREHNALQLKDLLLKEEKDVIGDVYLENMPMVVPVTVVPSDTLFPQQWNMTRIQAGGPGTTGWDISAGAATVVICVLDSGVDQTHPDLQLAGQGINLGTMMPPGGPTGPPNVRPHGTCCAGVAAAAFNNGQGVAGVAGNCRILPVAFQNWTDVEVAAGINWATTNGANVISMSFGHYGPGEGMAPATWNFAVIDPAIANSFASGVVLVAATGNENIGTFNRYPARHPQVIAAGASDQADNRKSPASPDGECWGSNFAADLSVVAPGALIPTTDIQGAAGYNNNGGAVIAGCVNYASAGDAAGNFFLQFNGTSSAAPHVAGLAGLLRSQYPMLTNLDARNVIERTADKVGAIAYADAAGFANGTRNAQMGYGRINVLRALDFADLFIKDWPGDNGVEPSSPPGGDFWDFSDIVVRPVDDNAFNPGDPAQSNQVERGQTNYIYVRATNNGPREGRNVTVDCRITPWVGLEFIYPNDWTAVDAMHVVPTPIATTFATIPPGGTAIAKFSVSTSQVETLWNWEMSNPWHPCMLARVLGDNDYAFATVSLTGTGLLVRRNSLAQRNLSVVDVFAGASVTFPMLAANELSEDTFMEILIDASRFAKESHLVLALEDNGKAFPLVEPARARVDNGDGHGRDEDGDGIEFLDRTRIRTVFAGCPGVLTLEKGSRFERERRPRLEKIRVEGGELVLRDGRRFVDIREPFVSIRLEKEPHVFYPLALHATIPEGARGEHFLLEASQRNAHGETVGGATAVYVVR